MNGFNFTQDVRQTLASAREESARLHHEYVGTEHMLLALCRAERSAGFEVVRRCDVDPNAVIDLVMATVKVGKSHKTGGPDLPYTSRAKKVLELAMSEARELQHDTVGTEHLLLGLIREQKGIAAQVLFEKGMRQEAARAALVAIRGETPPRDAPASPAHTAHDYIWQAQASTPHDFPWQALPERLRLVMAMAQGCAGELGVPEVEPVHAAIALLEHGHGAANAALHTLRFDRASALVALTQVAEQATSAGTPADEIRASDALADVLARAQSAMLALGARRPGTEHLLIGLLEGAPDVAAVFSERGVTAEVLRKEVRRNLG